MDARNESTSFETSRQAEQIYSAESKFMQKACYFLCGNQEKPYIHFNSETLRALVGVHKLIRVLTAYSAGKRKGFIEGADMVNSCLYGKLVITVLKEQRASPSQQ